MRHEFSLLLMLAAFACSSTDEGTRSAASEESGPAPLEMQLAGSDGKNHSLAELVEDGPVYLYFIKKDCPINAQALPWYKKVYEGLDKPESFVGVLHGDRSSYQVWNEEYQAPYLVLFDPDKTWIRHFGAERSPWVVEVGKDGSAQRVWKGYSGPALVELDAALAKAEGIEPAAVDVSSLPEDNQFG